MQGQIKEAGENVEKLEEEYEQLKKVEVEMDGYAMKKAELEHLEQKLNREVVDNYLKYKLIDVRDLIESLEKCLSGEK